jgi:hypothetical protein
MDRVRICFLCGKDVPIERRHGVFCSVRCEVTHQELERRAPPLDALAQGKPNGGRPRSPWPGEGGTGGGEKF